MRLARLLAIDLAVGIFALASWRGVHLSDSLPRDTFRKIGRVIADTPLSVAAVSARRSLFKGNGVNITVGANAMQNTTVRAAAEGVPVINRRTILTGLGAATAAVVTLVKAESSGLTKAGGFQERERKIR